MLDRAQRYTLYELLSYIECSHRARYRKTYDFSIDLSPLSWNIVRSLHEFWICKLKGQVERPSALFKEIWAVGDLSEKENLVGSKIAKLIKKEPQEVIACNFPSGIWIKNIWVEIIVPVVYKDNVSLYAGCIEIPEFRPYNYIKTLYYMALEEHASRRAVLSINPDSKDLIYSASNSQYKTAATKFLMELIRRANNPIPNTKACKDCCVTNCKFK